MARPSNAGRLKNEFSWSFSRHNLFDECRKKYWYTYYGSWEGWPLFNNDPRTHLDPLAAYLYRQKQMQSLAMYVGSVTHLTIEKGLKNRQRYRRNLDLRKMLEQGKALFDQGIKDAQAELWRRSPKKHNPLFEVYYGAKGVVSPPSTEQIEQGRQKVVTCLENWFNSPIVQRLILDQRAHWVSIEELDHFYLDGRYKVYVVIDFAMKWRGADEVVTLLFDWKTGSESSKTIDQLYSYAIYAHEVWAIPYSRMVLTPYYLYDNHYEKIGFQQEHPIAEAKLEEVRSFVRQSCEEMVSKIDTLENNQAAVRDFPYTNDRGKCRRCPFRELCEKVEYRDMDVEELREAVAEFS